MNNGSRPQLVLTTWRSRNSWRLRTVLYIQVVIDSLTITVLSIHIAPALTPDYSFIVVNFQYISINLAQTLAVTLTQNFLGYVTWCRLHYNIAGFYLSVGWCTAYRTRSFQRRWGIYCPFEDPAIRIADVYGNTDLTIAEVPAVDKISGCFSLREPKMEPCRWLWVTGQTLPQYWHN